MSQRKIMLAVSAVVLTAVIIWQYPALDYQWDYRTCLIQAADHYSNIASLRNAPDRPTYDEQSRLQCEANESRRRFEETEPSDDHTGWGLKAIRTYTSLIEDHNIDSYRPARASVYAALGQYEKSLADYNYLITTDPDNYWMYENRAKLYLQMGQATLALQDYQTLYEQALANPTSSQAFLDRIAAAITELEEKVG